MKAAAALFALALFAGTGAADGPASPAPPAPPSVTLAPLYEPVALSPVFADGKGWADAVPKRAPAEIVAAWRRSPARDPAGISAFVSTHFATRPDQPALRVPRAGLPLAAHIADLWPILTRTTRTAPRWSSLLPLPNPYVVPGGRFTEIYYWDSYFTMLGLDDQPALRTGMVDNFAHMIRVYGHIPNGSRTYYLSRSQPPFFFKMVALTYPSDPARAYAAYLPALKAEHRFWMKGAETLRPGQARARVVRMADGALLNRYWDDRATPRDESYAADVRTARASSRPAAIVYRNLRAGAESGWDFSSRWLADGRTLASIQVTSIVPPDLNSLMYGLEDAIAKGCAVTRDLACVTAFEGKAKARAQAMRRYLWNERAGLYDDYQWERRRLVGNVTAAGLYPLFVGLATRQEADRTAAIVASRLLKPGGLATTDLSTGEQWDAPNGWAPLQWIAVDGLRRYGRDQLAERIATNWLTHVATVYRETGKLLEKYDVAERRPGGGGEYPLQDGFGWTNGVTRALLDIYPAP